jgi:hypothetical protein
MPRLVPPGTRFQKSTLIPLTGEQPAGSGHAH